MLFQIFPSVILIVLTFTVFNNHESPMQALKNNNEESITSIFNQYMNDFSKRYIINAFKQNIEKEKEFIEKNKDVMFANIRYYSKEFVYAIVLA